MFAIVSTTSPSFRDLKEQEMGPYDRLSDEEISGWSACDRQLQDDEG
jgi:hypothetical protein